MGKRLPPETRQLRDEQFNRGNHYCNRCKMFKPVAEFRKCKKLYYGLKYHCKVCNKHYEQKPKTKNRAAGYYKKRHNKFKRFWAEEMGGECQRCGYSEFSSGLDFHHIYPDRKDHNPTFIINTGKPERIRQELNKCTLLCANCHRGIEAGNWSATFVKSDLGYIIKELK